ncbi:MAG: lysylphosphatidylglycerol synthase transmembrane domain-containing protein [Chloroflexi bacterium]|nr:lysylphosphatidylglycerol synthase transmembrane domain-containing protein [Chloroflexota bacterium]
MSRFFKDFRRMLPGIIISIILVAVILYFVDLKVTFAAIKAANYGLLLIVLFLGVSWLMVRGLVWRTLLRNRASYRDVFLTLMEGYLLNSFLPFRLGEIGRAFLLSRKSELKFVEILPTIIIERVSDLAFSAAIFVAAVPFVVGANGAGQVGFLVGGAVIVGLVAMYLLARNRQWALDVFHRLSQRWPAIGTNGGSFLEAFFVGLEVLTDPGLFVRFFLLMTLNWGMAIVQYFLITRAFFPQATIIWGMFVLGAAAFGGAIPSLPGGVGTLEGAMAGAVTLLSGNQSTALAVALTSRVLNYLYSGVFGLYGLSREGQTISGIYQQLMKFQSRSETTPESARQSESQAGQSVETPHEADTTQE